MQSEQAEEALPLDPKPADLNALAGAILSLCAEWQVLEQQSPVLPEADGAGLRELWSSDLPEAGCGVDALLGRLRTALLPFARRNGHPGFFGYVQGSAAPSGALADLLASMLNQNVTAWRSAPGATEMELLVVRWLAQMVGFEGDHGLLVGGGSAANLTALGCAWHRALGRQDSEVVAQAAARATAYLSREAHLSLVKALRFVGLPADGVRWIDTDGERRMLPQALRSALRQDLDAGRLPVCVCASAGTANTGAVDPLEELGAVAREAGVWFHVDGAYGAPAAMLPEQGSMRAGLARADSLSIDPHKWLFAPLDVGCVLLRDRAASELVFREDSDYTKVFEERPLESFAFFDHGLELSRRSRALKVWMILSLHGVGAVRAAIERNLEQGRCLAAQVREHPRLELLASGLSIVCFRYLRSGGGDLDELNRRLLDALVREGDYFLSPTRVDGVFALRVCIVNFRTRDEHVDGLLASIVRLGDAQESSPT